MCSEQALVLLEGEASRRLESGGLNPMAFAEEGAAGELLGAGRVESVSEQRGGYGERDPVC